jgi:hypothetical protein
MKSLLLTASIAIVLLAGASSANAQPPVENIPHYLHGSLAEAQAMVRLAFDRISVAQSAKRDRLGGHAGRAKELLRQANLELSLAAQTADNR